jgi:hypothetical protein
MNGPKFQYSFEYQFYWIFIKKMIQQLIAFTP